MAPEVVQALFEIGDVALQLTEHVLDASSRVRLRVPVRTGRDCHRPASHPSACRASTREAGSRGIEQFSQVKTVYVDYSGRLQRAQIDNRPPVTEEI